MTLGELMKALSGAVKSAVSAASHLNTAADVISAVGGFDLPEGTPKAISALKGLMGGENERKWLEMCMDYEQNHAGAHAIISGYILYAFPFGKTRDEKIQRWWYLNSFMTHILKLTPDHQKMFLDELVRCAGPANTRRKGYGIFYRTYHRPNGIPSIPQGGGALSIAEMESKARSMYAHMNLSISDAATYMETQAATLKQNNKGFLYSLASIWD